MWRVGGPDCNVVYIVHTQTGVGGVVLVCRRCGIGQCIWHAHDGTTRLRRWHDNDGCGRALSESQRNSLLLLQTRAIRHMWHAQPHHLCHLDPVGSPHKVVDQPQPNARQLRHHPWVARIRQLLTRIHHVVAHVAVAAQRVVGMGAAQHRRRTWKTP